MEILAAKQLREQRQPKREQQKQPERVKNAPLPEFPRRWIDAMVPAGWSPARQAAEAQFARGLMDEAEGKSEARRRAESLFETP